MKDKIIVCTYDEKLLPEKKTSDSVCWDMKIENNLELDSFEYGKISTWVKVYLPKNWQCKVFGRSSLPGKAGLMLANSVAIFDADYRGEYIMQFFNFTKQKVNHDKYTRLTQMEFAPFYSESWVYGTDYIPEIEFIVDKELYDNFDKKYPSTRWTGWIWSTWNK